MATNLAIDDRLVDEATRLGRHGTRHATVNEALEQCVARRKGRRLESRFGKLDRDPSYDYKADGDFDRIAAHTAQEMA